MLLKPEQDSKLQKLQDCKTILAGIHVLFKIVINPKILENSQEYVYREVILFIKLLNVKLLMSNFSAEILTLSNSEIMIK